MTTKTLYVTVNEGDPCQVVGSHPLRYLRGYYPNVFLCAVESLDALVNALLDVYEQPTLIALIERLREEGVTYEKQG